MAKHLEAKQYSFEGAELFHFKIISFSFLRLGQAASKESKTACVLASFSPAHGNHERRRCQDLFVILMCSCV